MQRKTHVTEKHRYVSSFYICFLGRHGTAFGTFAAFHHTVLGKVGSPIIQENQKAAHRPTGRIAEGDRNRMVENVLRHNIQKQHDKHRRPAVSGTAQSGGIHLVDAADQVARHDKPQELRAEFHYFFFAIKEFHHIRRKHQQWKHNDEGRG